MLIPGRRAECSLAMAGRGGKTWTLRAGSAVVFVERTSGGYRRKGQGGGVAYYSGFMMGDGRKQRWSLVRAGK